MVRYKLLLDRLLATCGCMTLITGCTNGQAPADLKTVDRRLSIATYSAPELRALPVRLDPNSTLFVFDIDNTLLASPPGQFAGSDQWYKWQTQLDNNDSRKIVCLLDMQGVIFAVTQLVATEDGNSREFVRSVQDAGFPTIAMTARSPAFRYSTERELSRNGFAFKQSTPDASQKNLATYTPERSRYIQTPRTASYLDVIAMLAGQHKGDALVDLLDRLRVKGDYKFVVFVDDDQKNIQDVLDTFRKDSISAFAVEYKSVETVFGQDDIDSAAHAQRTIERLFDQFERKEGCNL